MTREAERPPALPQGAAAITQGPADQPTRSQSTGQVRHIPVFGSPAWHVLPLRDPRRILAELVHDARSWRTLRESPHVAELIDDWMEWHNRRLHRAASHQVAAYAKAMGNRGYRWLSYRELERRRRLVSVEHCAKCGRALELVHPWPEWQIERLPDLSWVRCPEHEGVA